MMDAKKEYTVVALNRYWPCNADVLFALPVPQLERFGRVSLPPALRIVSLPDWAHDLGVDGGLLAPAYLSTSGEDGWKHTDWWGVAFWYLNGLAEREFELRHGPIHSYSFKLAGWNPMLWQYAWANRTALFLRRWAARITDMDETELFGPLPRPGIMLTHDIDAISKTAVIRFKQAVFNFYNAACLFRIGRLNRIPEKIRQAGRFLLSSDEYWNFESIVAMEKQADVRSWFNVYGIGEGKKTLAQAFFDPGYDLGTARLREKLLGLHRDGWHIGVHFSYANWSSSEPMDRERKSVEESLELEIIAGRQHWLRFGWEKTWAGQDAAGLRLDSTLGFNDRPSLRNGAALKFSPWDFTKEKPLGLKSIPMMLMDSHLYDYSEMDEDERDLTMARWLDELKFVHGEAAVVWHQQTFSSDYGWGDSYARLLELMRGSFDAI